MPVSSLNARLNVRTLSKPQPRAISCIPLFVNANRRMAAVTRRLSGMGSLMVDSIEKRDYQVIQAITLLIAMLNVFINLIIDLIYGLADPRIRLD